MGVRIEPYYRRLLVEPAPVEEVTAAGIIIPAQAQTMPTYGMVIHVGKMITDFKEGDHVMFYAGAGKLVKYRDKKMLLLFDTDILAFLILDDQEQGITE